MIHLETPRTPPSDREVDRRRETAAACGLAVLGGAALLGCSAVVAFDVAAVLAAREAGNAWLGVGVVAANASVLVAIARRCLRRDARRSR